MKLSDIRAVKVLSKGAAKCALSLLDVCFSKECLVHSLATKKDDKDSLDPDVIEGIRCRIILHCLICFIIIPVNFIM